jgi:hypothetical protein
MARRYHSSATWPVCLLCASLLTGVCGCGGTATVTGKVSYHGRPVSSGSVIFLGADQTARSGVIEPDGSFKVEGVPVGEVQIGVISRDPSKGRSVLRGGKPKSTDKKGTTAPREASTGWFPLPRQFEDPANSGLRCTLGWGRDRQDIDLK